MRKTLFVAAATAVLAGTGCRTLAKQAFQQPVVTLKNVRLNGVGLTGGSMDVMVNVYNPNGYRLDATRMTYNLIVDSVKFATGSVDQLLTVMENDSSTVTIPVNFTYAGVGEAGRQLINTGSVNYTVEGDVIVATPVGRFTIPYRDTRRFSAFSGTSR